MEITSCNNSNIS